MAYAMNARKSYILRILLRINREYLLTDPCGHPMITHMRIPGEYTLPNMFFALLFYRSHGFVIRIN
jgi:hypothetical protein